MSEHNVTAGGETRTTTYEYYTNSSENGYRHLKKEVQWDGQWKYYEYDSSARETLVATGFLDQAFTTDTNLWRTTVKSYTTLPTGSGDATFRKRFTPRMEVEYLLGKEIGRLYRSENTNESRLYRCQTALAAWNAADNLITITKYYTNGPLANLVKSTENPDGTMQIYTNILAGSYRTNIVWSGQADAGKTSIIKGTKTTTVLNAAAQTISVTTEDVASAIMTDRVLYSDPDELGRLQKATFLDNTFTWTVYGCCGIETVTNRDGTVINYSYDHLRRKRTELSLGILTLSDYDASGLLYTRIRQGTNASQIRLFGRAFDAWGRVLRDTNALQYVSIFQYATNASGEKIVTQTNPDTGTQIETYYRDDQLAKITGTAVHPIRHQFGVEQDGTPWRAYTKEIKLDSNFNDTSEWTKTYSDMLGRTYKTLDSDNASSQFYFNNLGQLWKQVDPDGNITLSTNINYIEQYTIVDTNRNSVFDWSGPDRITKTVSDVVSNSTLKAYVRRTQTYVYPTDGSSSTLLLSTTETAVNGLTNWVTRFGMTNKTETAYAIGATRYLTNTAPDGSFAVSQYQNGRLICVTSKNATGGQLSQTTYGYDAHGRQNTITDARNGATGYTFNDADQVLSVTTPPPGTGQSAQTTTSSYDNMGRVWKQVLPDGGSVTNEYWLTGELKRNYGSRTYPVGYGYDGQGRMTKMTNWSGFSSGAGTRVTTWQYDAYRGFLTNKLYDGSVQGPSYTYKSSGKLWTRAWARGTPRLTTTYGYNNAGDLSTATYSDGTTPNLSYGYDRRGRQTAVTNGTMVATRYYNDLNQLTGEANSGSVLSGLILTNNYDSFYRRSQVATKNGGTQLSTCSFGYDSASRMTNVTDGTYSAGYTYLANSPLVSQITFKTNTMTRMTTTKNYDYLNRLQSISSTPSASGQLPLAYGYQYNDANQRTRVTLNDGSFWIYQYDSLGQVTSGKKYWSDGIPVPGQQFEYGFDDIGNRNSTKAGGDQSGAGLRPATYSANSLNQYTSRTVPNAFDVVGIANVSASVTVNSSAADYRRGEYFQELVGVNNNSTSVWQSVTVTTSGGGTNTGNVFVPTATESYGYDLDGNTTNDGRWTFTWDAENRLVSMQAISTVPSGAKKKLDFAYDYQSRRIQKVVSTWNGSTYVAANTNKFLYDGWNLIAELNNANGVIRSYVWGLDLSGRGQGAGGVGGLLAIKPTTGNSIFMAYDGNGNVTGLIDATTGTTSGNFEYGPFGETVRVTPNANNQSPFRFSTKYADDESDFLYYGFRYYNSSTGRWLSRDLVGELGGYNLYGLSLQDLINLYDYLGLAEIVGHCAQLFSYIADFDPTTIDSEEFFDKYRKIYGVPTLGLIEIFPFAIRELANSANDAPGKQFDPTTKETRGWVSFKPKVTVSNGVITAYDTKDLKAKTGWTPIRLERRGRVLRYDPAEGRGPFVEVEKGGIGEKEIVFHVRHFARVGRAGQRMAELFTGVRGVPWIRREMIYTIRADGSYMIEFYGSFFPSHAAYVNGNRIGSSQQDNLIDFILIGGRELLPDLVPVGTDKGKLPIK